MAEMEGNIWKLLRLSRSMCKPKMIINVYSRMCAGGERLR